MRHSVFAMLPLGFPSLVWGLCVCVAVRGRARSPTRAMLWRVFFCPKSLRFICLIVKHNAPRTVEIHGMECITIDVGVQSTTF